MDIIEEFLKNGLYTNKNTIMSYRSHLRKYFNIIDQNPETYFNNGRNYEGDIIKFWEYLNDKPPMTKKLFINTVKRFLIRNNKELRNLDIWDTLKSRLKGAEGISEDFIPDNEELKRILLHTDIRTKAVSFIAITSGMRIGEILKLLPSDIHLDENPCRINIRAKVAKNNKRRTTFITDEAKAVLKEWYRVRDKYLENAIKKCICNAKKNPDDNRIFPYSNNTIRFSWNLAVKKAGFEEFDSQTNRRKLHFHCLRKFFRSYFGNADFAEHLIGHKGYLSTYRQYNDKQLAKEYVKFTENLLIFETAPDLTNIHKELSEKEQQINELKETMDEMKSQILELRLEKLEKANGLKK
jgi:integrase